MNTNQQTLNGKSKENSDLKFKLTPKDIGQKREDPVTHTKKLLKIPALLFSNLQKSHPWLKEFGISSKEMQTLPEYFAAENIQKNRFIYQKLRNYMIKAYWLEPKKKLLFTSVRRTVNGDVGSLLRLYKFCLLYTSPSPRDS